jgi:1,2-diacylglycerol 3-alpha-glucosyltransferase
VNVGLFTDCYLPTKNGVVTSIVQLKEGLERRGHKVTVVTVDAPHYVREDKTVYRFPSLPFNSSIQVRLGLVNRGTANRIIQEEHIEIVHTHTEFSLGRAAKRAAGKRGLPLIHTAHTMYEDYRHYLFFGQLLSPGMVRAWLSAFLSSYDTLVCPSIKAQDYFKSFVPQIQTVVIGNGVCKSRFCPNPLTRKEKDRKRKAYGIRFSDRVIIFVGRMAKEKRVQQLLDVLTPLLQKHPHYKALFVGSGPDYGHMVNATIRRGLSGQVIFTGYVDWAQMHELYSIADIFVTASLSEVHPMTLIEASMCGLPIVARRDDSYAGLVQDDYNGYLVESDLELAERLSGILCDEVRLTEFSGNGQALSAQFNSETHVERIESLYQQVLINNKVIPK